MNVIEIKALSKKYVIAHKNHSTNTSIKESITHWMKKKCGLITPSSPLTEASSSSEEFYALEDINLNIAQGDSIALLGRNGAGKSTLLKLISRIIEPSFGSIKIRGRVVSLLEVGTGFHPDLTGRENIFLNGVIMGMSYQEMKAKFDEIVAFSEIEKFLDTPIKHYSSGMYMRLGFAIAAHLNADILIVDEVLAVGDAQFQDKCMKKMSEIGSHGSTILFVSHNPTNVLSLCNKGLFLEKGRLKAFETIDKCLSLYVNSSPSLGLTWQGNAGDEHIRFMKTSLRAPESQLGYFHDKEASRLDVDFEVLAPHPDLILGISVLNSRHDVIAQTRLHDHDDFHDLLNTPGLHQLSFDLDMNLFHPGEYHIRLDCSLLNKKKILEDEILLKFALFSRKKHVKHEIGLQKEGITLGHKWSRH